jgi:hypothetical protein
MVNPLRDMREPDWKRALRQAVDRDGLKTVARQLGRSKSCLSGVLSGNYKAETTRIEERVRGALMNLRLECPVLGEIAPGVCQDWQEKPFAATNPERVAVYRACRAGCRHFRRS